MKNGIVLTILYSLFLVACEQEADIPLPKVEPKMAVSCFFSDQTDTLRVMLRWSDPVFTNQDKEGQIVRDALVVFYNNEFSVNLYLDETTGYYQAPVEGFSIEPGKAYSLSVVGTDGTTVNATSYVPFDEPDVRAASVTREVSLDQYGQYLVQFNFETLLGNINPLEPYYRLMYYQTWADSTVMFQSYSIGEVLYEFENGKEEDNLTLRVEQYGMDTTLLLHKAVVIHGSEDYYRFHKTVQSIGYGPFAEPTIVYSNINNGLGIFAGYRQLEILY
jgi:hypothetical protein